MDSDIHDPSDAGVYARRLSRVSETNDVKATSDICSSEGAVILKSGTSLNAGHAARIAKFKLQQPLETSLEVENEVNAGILRKHILQLINRDPIFKQIHLKQGLDKELAWLCSYYNTFPSLKQVMTVLSMQMKKVYRQSLLSAWIALLIAKNLKLDQKELESLFLASLAHDLGMLHIDESLLNKKGVLNADEWRQIYVHPIIAANILSTITGINSQTTRAVLEHHEKSDGTGYPKGKFEQELSQLGHILALADIVAVLLERGQGQGQTIRHFLPVMQINRPSYTTEVYNAFMSSFVNIDKDSKSNLTDETIADYIDKMHLKIKLYREKLSVIEKVTMDMGFTHDNRKIHSLQTVFMHVSISIHGSGIFDDGYDFSIEAVKVNKDSSAYREVEDAGIMLDEVGFQIKRIQRLWDECLRVDSSLSERFVEEILAIDALDEKIKDI